MAEWTALLDGALREHALQAVEELAEALRAPHHEKGPTLASGTAGLALLFAELNQVHPQRGHRDHARRLIQEAVRAMEERPLLPWLYSGFSGIAWAIERLETLGIPLDEELEEVDDALLELVSRRAWEGNYDLINGLVGIGLYALERMPRPVAIRCLEELVNRLDERAIRADSGVSWWTPPQHLPSHQRLLFQDGHYNLGAAHGVPAVVALLALTAEAGVDEPKARELAAGGARWLLANGSLDTPGARFPAYTMPGTPLTPSRSAWCYGDPGIALCLLVAARALPDVELEQTALGIAREAARRPAERTGVRDAGLCHGAAGLGHIYNRMYQASGDLLLKEAALSWFTRALEMRRPGQGIAGYLTFRAPPDRPDTPEFMPDGGLVSGATGIALALLSACHPHPPSWDGLLMASIPAPRLLTHVSP